MAPPATKSALHRLNEAIAALDATTSPEAVQKLAAWRKEAQTQLAQRKRKPLITARPRRNFGPPR